MSKYTEGPWRIEHCSRCHVYEIYGPKGKAILCPHYVGGFDSDGDYYGAVENESNAKLIAAAPDLLEALQEMMEYAGIIEERCDNIATNKARAAIKKATE